ncbi:MAG: VWA domain-containing protein [Halapricum sp.]
MIATPAIAGSSHTTVDSTVALSSWPGSNYQSGHGNAGPPGHGGPPGHDRGADARNVTVPDLNSSASALVVARDRALTLAEEYPDSTNDFERVADSINATLDAYRGVDRVDSRAAFVHATEAQRDLDTLSNSVDDSDVESVSKPLYAAMKRSVRLAILDSAHTVRRYEAAFENPGQRQRVESHLGNALDASERAADRLSDVAPRRGPGDSSAGDPTQRAKALNDLETAWKHTEKVLHGVEDNVEPRPVLSARSGFERNGTVVVPLEVTLSDVRPFEYENATVTVAHASCDPDPITLVAPGMPATYASGTTLLYANNRSQALTVTVTATASHDPGRTVVEKRTIDLEAIDVVEQTPPPDEYRSVSVSDGQSGVAVKASGTGLHENAIEIRDATPEDDASYRAGPTVRIENRTDFDEATVKIPIRDNIDRDGNLSVYTWDPESDDLWTPVETDIDPDAGVATAEVEHFSYFSVFWVEGWNDTTSDTIALEDEHVEGNLSDGNVSEDDPLKAEFAFVIDNSTSMSGERIHYARLAAQRFVGAMYADERGALATFDGSGSLQTDLTSDQEALNVSIEALRIDPPGNGCTNTGGGLQKGLGEITANGWDNRSNEMLLLADGGTCGPGPDPVVVAETAADQNITINAVGVGSGIDENELRSIAGATGGDFHHVESAEDLPETFERVAENRSLSLQDTDGDGIPDAVEEMDLRMPTGGPGVVGEPLHLDPFAADTSDDGILDNETVDVNYRIIQKDNETKLHAQVTYARSHPARVDTTGNGLTDREQIEGWEIQYTPDKEHTRRLMEDLEAAADLSELGYPDEYFRIETVTSNPLVEDTNGDGLSDREERQLGIDPRERDTTGDGITDRRALEGDADPTLYDITPPELDIYYVAWEKPPWSFDTNYAVQFAAEDQAGLDSAAVFRGGEEETNHTLLRRHDSVRSEFTTGAFDTITDFYSGTSVTVEASDRNDNTAKTLAIQRHDVFGQVSSELAEQGVVGRERTKSLGTLSGFSTGAVETAEMLDGFLTDPVSYVSAIGQVVSEIDNIDEIIRQLPASIEQRQQQNNPHEEGTDAYRAYRQGWYEGYIGFMVLESAVPAGELGKAAKSSSKLQSAVNTLDKAERLSKAAKYAAKTADTAKAPARYTGYQLSWGLTATKAIGQQTGRKLLDGAQTAGQKVRWARHAEQMDSRTARLVADGGTDFQRAVYRAADSDAIDSYQQLHRGVTRIDELDGAAKTRAKHFVRDADGAGVRLLVELDDDALATFFRMEQKSGFDGNIDFRQWRENVARGSTDIDPSWTNEYINDVEKATGHANIKNADGLVTELSGNNANPSQVLGQAGEARSAIRYAEFGYDVTVEPGAGDYDLAVKLSGQTEYIDVKTTQKGTLDKNYWDRQTDSMNKKYRNADNVAKENAVLEVQTTKGPSELDIAKTKLEERLTTRVNTYFGEVRIRSTNADTRTVNVEQ